MRGDKLRIKAGYFYEKQNIRLSFFRCHFDIAFIICDNYAFINQMKIYIGTIIFAAIGLILIIGSLIKIINNIFFLRLAQTAIGTVVYLKTGRSGDRHTVYLPVVEFAHAAGHKIQITSTVGANPPDYNIGDQVSVRYLPKNPRAGRINSFWEMWALPLICFTVGLIVLGTAFILLPK